MNFLNSAFDSSNFIKSNVNQNSQWNSTTNTNSTNKPNNTFHNQNSNTVNETSNIKSNLSMLQINPALNRTYCSKTQLYCESISRALDIPTCNVVPFFGSFLHDFRQILDGVSSQVTMCNKNIQKPVEVL